MVGWFRDATIIFSNARLNTSSLTWTPKKINFVPNEIPSLMMVEKKYF